jgi:hypothetical protein
LGVVNAEWNWLFSASAWSDSSHIYTRN